MGFCYLVDWKQRIRWAGIGYATPAELEALDRCLEELLDRVQAGVKE
jgi:ATPase complex subunit ATP10